MLKDLLIQEFDKMYKKEVANKEVWKARAYSKVVKQLKAFPGEINSFEDIKGLDGIGKKIELKIKEIIDTGHLAASREYNADDAYRVIDELMQIHGIGPTKANDLVRNHGITSVADLRNNIQLLNDVQKLGLKYVEQFQARIPRREMEKHDAQVNSIVKSIHPQMTATVVGSYRRGAGDSGDVDIIICGSNVVEGNEKCILDLVVSRLKEDKYIVDTFGQGGKKFMGVSRVKYGRLYRRLDLMITLPNEFPFASLYFTGSAEFNTKLRAWVLTHKGLSLSEYGLKDIKSGVFVQHDTGFRTEGDVFRYLGLKYIAPRDRTPDADLVLMSN
jgi:DNA polymerase beta